jgi:hypothetical protein
MNGQENWIGLLGGDPVPGLLACGEPAARWVTRTAVLDQPADDPRVVADRAAVLADPGTATLIGRLPDWGAGNKLSGHHDPRFAPHLLNLLADMGVTAPDHPRIGLLLDQFLAHQDQDGRFMSFGQAKAGQEPVWGSLPCDHHLVTEVLVRYGRGNEPSVQRALARIAADLTVTAQGQAWLCTPHSVTGFRGPGPLGHSQIGAGLTGCRAGGQHGFGEIAIEMVVADLRRSHAGGPGRDQQRKHRDRRAVIALR